MFNKKNSSTVLPSQGQQYDTRSVNRTLTSSEQEQKSTFHRKTIQQTDFKSSRMGSQNEMGGQSYLISGSRHDELSRKISSYHGGTGLR